MTHAMTAMPKYESYKESGVDWLGEIPSEWSISPGMKLLRERSDKNKGMIESRVLSLSYGNIIVKPEEKLVGLVPESFETYQIVDPDDIIVRCTDLQNDQTSLRTGLAKDRGIITSAYLNLQPRAGQSSRFLHYYLHALDLTKVLYKFGSGLRQNLSFNDFKHLPIPSIPYEEQEAIAKFLNEKTVQIDEAIGIKERQIALLKERKQIIIQNAVTKGLNPNAPMKDSGVDWIGDIPSHWEIRKISHAFNLIGSGTTPTAGSNLYYENGDFNFLQTGDLNDSYIEQTSKTITSKAVNSFTSLKNYPPNSLIVAMYGATIGKTGILKVHSYTNQACCVLANPKNAITKFYQFVFIGLRQKIISLGYGGGQPNISQDLIKSLRLPSPPQAEQKEIVEYIENKSRQIDAGISAQQEQIDKLKEYKASLINSAVTGKIKVI